MSVLPPNGWERPTLRHHFELTAQDHKNMVRCVCGRQAMPSDMVDVRGLDGDMRLSRVKEHPVDKVPDFLCEPCIEVLHSREQIDRVEISRQMGAPPEWCGWYAAKISRRARHTGMPKDVHPDIAEHMNNFKAKFALADALLQSLDQVAEAPRPNEVHHLPVRGGPKQ